MVAWATVKDRLVVALPAVVGASVSVIDGPVVTGNAPSAYITVGYAPSATGDSSGTFSQDVGPDGFSATETGSVVCELAAVTGSTTIPDAFATFDLIAAWVQADMTLGGVLEVGSTCTVSAVVVQEQTRAGAVQRLVVSINYFTRL